jgi:two-component system sensor histidine kinase/response regulator
VNFTALPARAVPQDGDRTRMEFRVADTGQGIAEHDVERLFEPFSQADASTTRRFGGTGLGLAICRRLASAMQGEIVVQSTLGAGSTFVFSVPLVVCAQAVPAQQPRTLRGRRVLVVDDNATNRLILKSQLDSWDVECDAVADARSAWEQLRGGDGSGRSYDIVVLDLSMPDVDGLQLARRMTADPVLTSVPTLMLTSAGSVPQADLDEAGVGACLAKPVRSSLLHDALVRLVAADAGAAASEPVQQPAPPDEDRSRLDPVLVVEDNEINRLFAEGALRSLGYRVELVADGEQALRALSRSTYAAVLMDCHMPVMDGFEATRELRRREGAGPRTAVIAMTAAVLPEDRLRCLEAGMDDFVAKPVDVTELRQALELWTAALSPLAPTPASPTTDVLDPERLAVLRELGGADGRGMLPALVATFTAAAAERRARLRLLWEQGDGAELAEALHELRGAAATLGVAALAQRCAQLEETLRAGGAVGADGLAAVEDALDAGCQALAELVAGDAAPA